MARRSFTQQLRDYADFADENDLQFDLYVRYGADLSEQLEEQIENGTINLFEF